MDDQFNIARPKTSRLNTARVEDVHLFSIETAALNRHAKIQETKSTTKNDDTNALDWLAENQTPRNTYSQSISVDTPRAPINFFQRRDNPPVLSNPGRVTPNTSISLPTYSYQPKEDQERNNFVVRRNPQENPNRPVTARPQQSNNIYKIPRNKECVKLLLRANFRDELGRTLNEDFKVTMDITSEKGEQEPMERDYTIVLGGRPMEVMEAHGAIELLLENAFTREVFDKTRGFVIYKIEAMNMVQRCIDHHGMMCQCQLSESDGLIIWYFTSQKTSIKAVSTNESAVRNIIEKNFTSSTIKIPKEWTKEIIDGYSQIMMDFCETISDEDTVLIQQETDHYLVFGLSQSVKTLIASQEKLQKQMLIRSCPLTFEEYQIQFLLLNCQQELKQLEEDFRNTRIVSCLQQGYFVGPIPVHAEIKGRLLEMVSNLTRDEFQIEDANLGLILSTQATDLKDIGLKQNCQIDIEETSVPQSCSVPTATLNTKSSEFTPAAMSVDIRRGDLAQQSVDLVVICSTSEHLLNDILSKAGQDVEKVVRASLADKDSKERGFQTDGGDLLCRHLLFLPWLTEKLDDQAARRSIHRFFSTAMQHAAQNRQTSIAFPALGCGKLSYNPNMIAEVILDETQRYLDSNLNILIVLLPEQEEAYVAFCQQLTKLRRKKPSKEQTSIPYTKTEMKVSITGYQKQVEKTSQAIMHHLAHCFTSEHIDEFPLHNWNQATIDSYFRYCIEHLVLPEVDIKSERLTLIGTKNDVLITSKEFYRLKSMKAEEARLASFARLAVWIYETNRGYTKKYSLKLNALIEDAYHHKKKEISFRNDDNIDCCINFKQMVEKTNQEQRLVIRTDFQTPSDWAPQTTDVQRFSLDPTDSEYVAILAQFNKTMLGKCTIVRIDRIQNKRWYTAYKTFRDYSKQAQTEESLFHGCPKTSADMIINTCFNRSFAGVNGVVYGVGVYFSRNASYSHRYTHPNPTNKQRCMFLAKVLVGKTIVGASSMKVPPAGYDSTTDNNHIIVTYHDDQAYAEYLITYETPMN